MDSKEDIDIIISFLSNYFKPNQEEIDFLEKVLERKDFKKKEIIHNQGQVQKYFGFIVKGAVRFYFLEENGKEATFEFAFESTPIGEYNDIISGIPSSASAETLEKTTLVTIYKDHFIEFITLFPRYFAALT